MTGYSVGIFGYAIEVVLVAVVVFVVVICWLGVVGFYVVEAMASYRDRKVVQRSHELPSITPEQQLQDLQNVVHQLELDEWDQQFAKGAKRNSIITLNEWRRLYP